MKIMQINKAHYLTPKTIEEKSIMDKTLSKAFFIILDINIYTKKSECLNSDIVYTDYGNDEKWNDFMFYYDKKTGRSQRPSQKE